jgi:formylglycine-generating enzyme required for sulfatase activity
MRNTSILAILRWQLCSAVFGVCLMNPAFGAEPASEFENSLGMRFHHVPGGEFEMGTNIESRRVRITKPYWLAVYEVTQKQFESVLNRNPSRVRIERESDDERLQWPVESVSVQDACDFCQALTQLPAEREAGRTYRLPTEAEWEFAHRAGTRFEFGFGDNQVRAGTYGWLRENSGDPPHPHPVGKKKPNGWGFYDMEGNVAEICADLVAFPARDSGLKKTTVVDPIGPRYGFAMRVVRGSDFRSAPLPAGVRSNTGDDCIGFRVVCIERQIVANQADPEQKDLVNSANVRLKPISAGKFQTTLPKGRAAEALRDSGREDWYREQEVSLTYDFFISECEITCGQYRHVMGALPEQFPESEIAEDDYPVRFVNWFEAVEFCERLGKLPDEVQQKRLYRLPTEAEWEYCSRAGRSEKQLLGERRMLERFEIFRGNSDGRVERVRTKKPNPWGLFDMLGNVSEWCEDHLRIPNEDSVVDPIGWMDKARRQGRVVRGQNFESAGFRYEERSQGEPGGKGDSLGFRIVMLPANGSHVPLHVTYPFP